MVDSVEEARLSYGLEIKLDYILFHFLIVVNSLCVVKNFLYESGEESPFTG